MQGVDGLKYMFGPFSISTTSNEFLVWYKNSPVDWIVVLEYSTAG